MFSTPIYFWGFAGCVTAIVVSTLERRETKYGLGARRNHILHDLNVFITAAFTFNFVALGNAMLCTGLRPLVFVWVQVLAAAGVLAFAGFMELRYRKEARAHRQEMLDEIALLQKELERDPGNAAYLERLEELYEKTGDVKAAVACLKRLSTLNKKTCNMQAAEVFAERALKLGPAEQDGRKAGKSPVFSEPDPADSPFFALAAGYCRFLADLLKSAGRLFRFKGSSPE